VALLIAVVGAGSIPAPAAAQRFLDVRLVATDTLVDVAVTTLVSGQAIIHYSPAFMERFGPRLAAFFLAHEYGHVFLGHTGGALVDRTEFHRFRQRQELEADCYAASRLGLQDPDAVAAAAEFFARLGPLRFDQVHPSGSDRATRIQQCTPTP